VTRTAGQSETVGYDPFGLSAMRTVAGQVTWYLGRQATVTGIGGALKADVHVEVNGQRVASVRVGATPRTLFLHRDRLTSVVGTTLAGRVAGASYRYTPHGAVEAASGDTRDSASELGYAGTLRLSGGLLWMGARVYDPALKIFLQPDPLAPHTYAYADGDPINRWDPTGLQSAYCGEMIRCPSDDDRIKVGPRWEDREQEPPPPTVVTNGEFLDGTEAPNPGLPVNTSPFPSSPGTHFAPGDLSGRAGGGPGGDGGGALTDPRNPAPGSQRAKGNVLIGFGGSAVLLAAGQDRSSGVAVSLDSGSVNGFASNGSGAGLSGGQYGLYAGGGTYFGYIQGGPGNVGGPFVNYIFAVPGTNLSIVVFLNRDMQLQGAAVGYGPGIGFTRTGTSPVLVPLIQPANGP